MHTELKSNSDTKRYIKFMRYIGTQKACLECLIVACQDSRTNSHFNVIGGHGAAAKDEPKGRVDVVLEERRLPRCVGSFTTRFT